MKTEEEIFEMFREAYEKIHKESCEVDMKIHNDTQNQTEEQ